MKRNVKKPGLQCKRAARWSAFTLIELLISLSILSIVTVIAYTSFVSVRRIVEVHQRNEEMMREVRRFLEKLDVEVSGAVYAKTDEQTLLLSRRLDLGVAWVNNLTFTTLAPQQWLEIGRRGEIIRVEYEVTQNEENTDLFTVKKKLYLHTMMPPESLEPVEYTIRDDFSSFMLRFKSNGKWFDTWDTKKMDRLPDGIELTFSLGDKKYREFFNVFMSEM